MELNREQKRLLMLHEYKVGTNAADTVRRINEAWGEGTACRQNLQFMRKKTSDSLRRNSRNSQPSTSSESDALFKVEAHRSLRERAVRKSSVSSERDPPSTSFASCSEVDEPATSSSLRRSLREPRPKRILSPIPIPISPKRRLRAKASQNDDSRENEATAARKTGKSGNVSREWESITSPDLLGKSQSHLASRGTTSGNCKPVHSPRSSDVAYETTVADDDMENDLVDIQPFESVDTTSEVFVSAKFVPQRNPEEHVSVSVLTVPQLSENIEHSTEVPHLKIPSHKVPPLEKEAVLSLPPSSAPQTQKDPSGSFDQSNPVVATSPTRIISPVKDHHTCARTSEDRSETVVAATNENLPTMDETCQMEPPVLDGPIIPSQCEMKPIADIPPTLMADGIAEKPVPRPVHYVVGEIYRVHTPNGTEQEVQLAVMDDGSQALVNGSGEIVDMAPEDSYATVDICDIDFNFLDDKNIVCGLCGEVVSYSTLFTVHLNRVHPEMLAADMLVGGLPYVEYLKNKLEHNRKNINSSFKYLKQTALRRAPRKVSQIRINPNEMSLAQLEVALRRKLLEKMGRRVSVSLVDKEHVKCGICNSVISINKKFEIVHVVRHFNAWHPTNHQCAGQWQKKVQRPGLGKPLSKQDFAVIDLSHTQPDNLQCIWCGMFIDATTIAVHFTECHPGDVEVPKCLLCIQELVINARIIEKFGSDFDVILPDEFHIKVGKLNKLFTSESQMDSAIEKYLDTLNGKRKKAPMTVERRVIDGGSVVVHTTAMQGDDSADDVDEVIPRPRPTNTNSRQVFGRHNRPKRSMVQPIYRQAPPTNSDYVKVISDSHWKCKICDADLYGAVISACAIRHFKLKHPQDSDSLQFEVVRARLDRISDGCMEFVHPQMLECLICRLTYQLHKPYNVCRGIRHLKSRHPEIMPEFNGEPLRRYRKTGTALRLDDDPNIPRRRRDPQLSSNRDNDLVARMKAHYPIRFNKVQTVYGATGEPMYVLMDENDEADDVIKENIRLMSEGSFLQDGKGSKRDEGNEEEISSEDVKPRQEVVFELSYDYNNLDADGRPRKHLVRVTPGVQNKSSINADSCPKYIMENEDNVSITEAQLVQSEEANEVFFDDDAHGNENSTEDSTVVLGDVLFIDADGNEIIQRTTALPDGTVQQQYLGQAEDGTLFVLSDVVSAGLHPSADAVEDFYEEELVNDNVVSQNLVLEGDCGNQVSNVSNDRNQRSRPSGHRAHTEVRREQELVGTNNVIMEEAYNDDGALVVEEFSDCLEIEDEQPQYSREEVIGDDIQYDEEEIAVNEQVFRERLVAKHQEDMIYNIDGKAQDKRYDGGILESGEGPSIIRSSQQNISKQNPTLANNR
ncbi:hypothetical protein KIN20_000484 [Parelaphostrongylus tenuis]|uniref:C2H2-type domain-containing protein n=1 Tax=Parelaphostrongylus tenuis TaxID=148309 RepID=A0AAD5LW69_PARTN|nr:hypothetical protein KIN20_000484 [Parelaphostrongylus tenuis]